MKTLVILLFVISSLFGNSSIKRNQHTTNVYCMQVGVEKYSLNSQTTEKEILSEDLVSTTIEFELLVQNKTRGIIPSKDSFEEQYIQLIRLSTSLPLFYDLPPPNQSFII